MYLLVAVRPHAGHIEARRARRLPAPAACLARSTAAQAVGGSYPAAFYLKYLLVQEADIAAAHVVHTQTARQAAGPGGGRPAQGWGQGGHRPRDHGRSIKACLIKALLLLISLNGPALGGGIHTTANARSHMQQ